MASLAARARWVKVHEQGGESLRRERVLMCLTVMRCGIDPRPVMIQVVDDGGHRRKRVEEDGRHWIGLYGRKALVKWFEQMVKSAGV